MPCIMDDLKLPSLVAQVKHPDMPKKPLTPYFRFFMSKRKKYSAKHPEMNVTQLTKDLSKKYAALSERKRVIRPFQARIANKF